MKLIAARWLSVASACQSVTAYCLGPRQKSLAHIERNEKGRRFPARACPCVRLQEVVQPPLHQRLWPVLPPGNTRVGVAG